MIQPNQQRRVEKMTNNCKEAILFNSDTLSNIISFLPSVDLLNLALTSTRFGVSNTDDSLIKNSARIAIQDIASEEQLGTLPYYNGKNSLADYHYLQFMRGPLTFDQLVGRLEYVNTDDKSCISHTIRYGDSTWKTAFSNNILRAGKHYVSFQLDFGTNTNVNFTVGVMRPGDANQKIVALGRTPLERWWNQHFTQNMGHGEHDNTNNSVQCCMYCVNNGFCHSSDWGGSNESIITDSTWEGMQPTTSGDELGLLLNLEEGTLSVYKNGRKLGVMKRGLAGPYCWVVSLYRGVQVTIKRGTAPPSEISKNVQLIRISSEVFLRVLVATTITMFIITFACISRGFYTKL